MTEPYDLGDGQGGQPDRDPRLPWFASGGRYDKAIPSAPMVDALERVTGSRGRPLAEATEDEVTGMLTGWAAVESRAAARKLAAVREIIRRHADVPDVKTGSVPDSADRCQGDLPPGWGIDVAHEVAFGLHMSWQAAESLVNLAWDLEGRLPAVGRLLDEGVVDYVKAKIIAGEFSVLDDEKVTAAEEELLAQILGADRRLLDEMTPGKIGRICERIVCGVDPEGARKRREAAERDNARVKFFRDHGGAGTLFATGLPADEALRGESNIQKRAREYRAARIYPGDSMDMLRVLALVDSVNGRSLAERVALYRAERAEAARRAGDTGYSGEPGSDDGGDVGHENDDPDEDDPDEDDYPDEDHYPDEDGPIDEDGPDGGSDPGGGGTGGGTGDDGGAGSPGDGGVPAGTPDPGLPSLTHLTLPLAGLAGLADRVGEAPGYGALDPELARRLGQAAAASPRSRFCLTVTDAAGHAVAHGCARLIRNGGPGPPRGWDLVPDRSRAGPDGGFGAWILTVPGGRRYRVDLYKIPVGECDHRYATGAYRPGDLLRHLVEVRDGECTSPSCSMPARLCDFEHAQPYDQGGATCACNAGMRSRRCHRVKQVPGWRVTESRPGWHEWTTRSGRRYTKGPMRYPA